MLLHLSYQFIALFVSCLRSISNIPSIYKYFISNSSSFVSLMLFLLLCFVFFFLIFSQITKTHIMELQWNECTSLEKEDVATTFAFLFHIHTCMYPFIFILPEYRTSWKQLRNNDTVLFQRFTLLPSIHNHMYSFQVNQPVSHNVWQHNVFRKSVQTSRECRRNELTACLICHAKWHPIPYSETKQNSTETEPLPKPDGLIVREQFNNDLNA